MMSTSTRKLVGLVDALRYQHARALRADLLSLEARYGHKAVSDALTVSQQQDLRASRRRPAPAPASRTRGEMRGPSANRA